MKITLKNIKIKDLVKNYVDNGDGGVFGFDGKLEIRPPWQREFVYEAKERDEVIRSILKKFPIGLLYWAVNNDETYSVIDGQQRIISICQYVSGVYSVDDIYFHNMTDDERKKFLNYELMIQFCEGTEREKLDWFRVINIATKTLTNQELLNATYYGTWLSDAKNFFSKNTCVAGKLAEGYIKGSPIRQEYLEKVLSWIADRDGLESGQAYMALHQHDADANDLWIYFQKVINWAKMLFPGDSGKGIKGLTENQDWGILFNKYENNSYNSNDLAKEVKELILDDDVSNNKGIIPYLLSERKWSDQRYLNIRTFSEKQKMNAYTKQKGKCAICGKSFAYEEMQGDHIVPWSRGGHTTDDNCQMLCKDCNSKKSGR